MSLNGFIYWFAYDSRTESPPTVIVHGTRLKSLSNTYQRYLENFFRKRFKLVGTPVRFIFREGANPYEG